MTGSTARLILDRKVPLTFPTTPTANAPMPANLTPQYLKAEEEYRRAATVDEELRCLQVMLQEIPKHKEIGRAHV